MVPVNCVIKRYLTVLNAILTLNAANAKGNLSPSRMASAAVSGVHRLTIMKQGRCAPAKLIGIC